MGYTNKPIPWTMEKEIGNLCIQILSIRGLIEYMHL